MSLDTIRRLNKDVQHMINGGDFVTAEQLALVAHSQMRDPVDASYTSDAILMPRVRHRMGQIILAKRGPDEAAKHFKLAESLFDSSNVVGRSMVIRDEGWAYQQQSRNESPRAISTTLKRLETAIALLPDNAERGSRIELEKAVTCGMRHRLFPQREAITTLQELDVLLKTSEHSKLIYRLDNLRWLARLQTGRDKTYTLSTIGKLKAQIYGLNELWYAHSSLCSGRFLHLAFGPLCRTLG